MREFLRVKREFDLESRRNGNESEQQREGERERELLHRNRIGAFK